jgi:hypothetical protein
MGGEKQSFEMTPHQRQKKFEVNPINGKKKIKKVIRSKVKKNS